MMKLRATSPSRGRRRFLTAGVRTPDTIPCYTRLRRLILRRCEAEERVNDSDEIARALERIRNGDRSALSELLPHIYDDLRRLARGLFRDVPSGFTLQPTALVHEAYVRLAGSSAQTWESRKHFLDVAAMAMRQLLSDHSRRRRALKRGGAAERVDLGAADVGMDGATEGVDLLALDEALTELERLDPRQARIVHLRIFAGMTVDETAELLGVSRRTVMNDWRMARMFLSDLLIDDDARGGAS